MRHVDDRLEGASGEAQVPLLAALLADPQALVDAHEPAIHAALHALLSSAPWTLDVPVGSSRGPSAPNSAA